MNWQISGVAVPLPDEETPRRLRDLDRAFELADSLSRFAGHPSASPRSTCCRRIHLRAVSALISSRPATVLIAAHRDG
jgi:hypothetical protein